MINQRLFACGPRIHRRTFLERLGLGAGAFLLSPIVKTLVAQAEGTLASRKRFIVMLQSNGFHFGSFAPPEFQDKAVRFGTDVFQSSAFTIPTKFAPLASFKDRMLLVDGLVNQQGKAGHCAAHVLMSCMPVASSVGDVPGGTSGGITFDQHVANVLGRNMPYRSIHLGAKTGKADGKADGQALLTGFYARQRGESIPIQLLPQDAYTQILGGVGPNSNPGAMPIDRKAMLANKQSLLDFIRDDVRRVRDRLSALERNKLDEYLAAVEDAGKRLQTLSQTGSGPACSPDKVTANPGTPEQRFEAMVDIGTAALTCGLTNVLTLNFSGLGYAYQQLGLPDSYHEVGHNGVPDSAGWHVKLTAQYCTNLARMLTKLNSVREGDKTIFDNSVLFMSSDNGEAHHARAWRWPALVVGNAGGALKANGRYIRYPARKENNQAAAVPVNVEANQRPMGDLFSTLGHALGAPIDDFGKGGMEKVKGPLNELL